MKINEVIPKNHPYTAELEHHPQAVKKLFYRGELPNSRVKTVAIVGARKPSNYGREVAQKIATEVAHRGGIVVSGMALGIDGVAHKAAIQAGGITLAVLANGVDRFYPSSHAGLGKQILETGGAILSEYNPGMSALPHQFLERNRIVSGLADAVVIVEANIRSGTLSTAGHALEQGKEVFAVPGNITSPLSAGCNKLIRDGATPLTDISKFIDTILPKKQVSKQISLLGGDSKEENLILELISKGIKNGDELLKLSKLPASDFNQAITMLEVKGLVANSGGEWSLN